MPAAAGSNLGLFLAFTAWANRMVDQENEETTPVTVPGAPIGGNQAQPGAIGLKNRETPAEKQAQPGSTGGDPERLGSTGLRGSGSNPGLIQARRWRFIHACGGGCTVPVWEHGGPRTLTVEEVAEQVARMLDDRLVVRRRWGL